MSPVQAAIAAGSTRLRPVLMTAAAMIVGMLPMAIGGPGEEQNAVLARAVIGGLVFGTCTTLLVVPYLYATLRRFAGEHKRNEIDFGETPSSEKGLSA
jgi:multidrug efflux pump subunit AcrB